MAAPIHITDQEFDAFLTKHPLVIVDFWAEWCGPCKRIAPALEELASKYDGKLTVAKVNVDENPKKMMMFGIMGIPTLLIFRGGTLVDTIVGAYPKAHIEERILKQM
ncbi:MAG TPA: thioredoxin [Thermoplasmata archaeon]|jgi:thioredoxin 1|nr:thioredoxin [Thermoplasmata archaeon]